ncbi:MAG: hypothetical protein HY673_01220 [Chloroflexi bacterium]|nr:hypothetical protein [Chloroflexota bacterium]
MTPAKQAAHMRLSSVFTSPVTKGGKTDDFVAHRESGLAKKSGQLFPAKIVVARPGLSTGSSTERTLVIVNQERGELQIYRPHSANPRPAINHNPIHLVVQQIALFIGKLSQPRSDAHNQGANILFYVSLTSPAF